MKKTILVGYGNPDRGDDGFAWHLLQKCLEYYSCADDDLFSSDVVMAQENVHLWFNFQLLPEMADKIAEYERAVFIDAHTGEIKEEICYLPIKPAFQNSPFTHHFTAASCLALAEALTGHYPESWMLSVRGYQFAFNRDLSKETLTLLQDAFQLLLKQVLE